MRYKSGNIYEGEWSRLNRGPKELPHGKGKMTYPNGDVYEGDFHYGRKWSNGKMTYADGSRYQGKWEYDKKIGLGETIYADDSAKIGRVRTFKSDPLGPFKVRSATK